MPDTRDKRSSAVGSRRLPWLRRFVHPAPDAAVEDQGDRQQTAFVYRGIEAGAAVVPSLTASYLRFLPGSDSRYKELPGQDSRLKKI